MTIFVSCSPGMEALLLDELSELGIQNLTSGYCGVLVKTLSADQAMKAIYTMNYGSRLASRVLLPLQEFRCYDQTALYKAADRVDWKKFFRKGQTFAIDANVSHPKLKNSLFCAQVVKDAICDQLRKTVGSRPSIDVKEPDIQLNLFIHREQGILSFDTSGSPLHKRGYRQDAGEAPLQESTAAALLRIANFSGKETLIDPCCGSGTLLIEAALIASQTPPGYLRRNWGFFQLPEFNNQEWLVVKNYLDSKKQPLTHPMIGCEIDSTVARYCRANLRAAGFLDHVEIVRSDFSQYEPTTSPNFLITNPPHGKRLMGDKASLKELYRNLGDFMKRKLAKPGRGFVFVGDPNLAKEVGLAAKRRHVINNSGVDSRLLEFDVY